MSHFIRKITKDTVAPNTKRGGDLRVMLSPLSVAATSGFMGIGTLQPGEYISEHYHPHSEEFLCVTRGLVLVRLESREITLGPDDALLVPIGVRHRIENPGDTTAALVFSLSPLAPRPDLGHVDCEPLPGEGALPQVGG